LKNDATVPAEKTVMRFLSFPLRVNPELSVGREDRDGKAGFFTKQKSLGVAGTTFKLFCEVKSPDFPSNPVIQLKIPG
jgi:hypothetical protein